MLCFYFVESPLANGDLIALLSRRKSAALALKPELAFVKKFIIFTHAASYKAFLSGTARAEKFCMEWLARTACTPNLSRAREICAPGKTVGIVSEGPLSDEELAKIGKEVSYNPSASHLESFFKLSPTPTQSVEDLLIERSAVAFIG